MATRRFTSLPCPTPCASPRLQSTTSCATTCARFSLTMVWVRWCGTSGGSCLWTAWRRTKKLSAACWSWPWRGVSQSDAKLWGSDGLFQPSERLMYPLLSLFLALSFSLSLSHPLSFSLFLCLCLSLSLFLMKGAGFSSLFYFKSVKNLHSLFYCLQTWMCCLSSQVQACFILLLHFYLKYRLSDCSYVILFWYFYILLFLYFYTVLFLYRASLICASLIFPADIAC